MVLADTAGTSGSPPFPLSQDKNRPQHTKVKYFLLSKNRILRFPGILFAPVYGRMSGAGRIAGYLRKYPDGMPGLNKIPAEPGASCPPDRADIPGCRNRGMSCLNKWKPGSKKSLAAGGTDLQKPLYSPGFRNRNYCSSVFKKVWRH